MHIFIFWFLSVVKNDIIEHLNFSKHLRCILWRYQHCFFKWGPTCFISNCVNQMIFLKSWRIVIEIWLKSYWITLNYNFNINTTIYILISNAILLCCRLVWDTSCRYHILLIVSYCLINYTQIIFFNITLA